MPINRRGSTLSNWFGFKRDSYEIEPHEAPIVAFNADFAREVKRRSERYLISNTGPKFVLLELRGDGKTHIVNFVLNDLEKLGIIKKVGLDCPAMTSGAKFTKLQKKIIERLDEKNILLPLFKTVFDKYSKEDPIVCKQKITEELGFADLANAIATYFFSGKISKNDLLRYLKGDNILKKLQDELDVSEPIDADKAIKVLQCIANAYQQFFEKTLVLVIDEADGLSNVKQQIFEFKEAFRKMAEIRSLGFVIIFNISTIEDLRLTVLPTMLKDPGVVSRIGSDNYMFKPNPMKLSAVRPLILAVNKEIKGEGFKDAFKKVPAKSNVTKETFPFSSDAIIAIEKKIERYMTTSSTGDYILPRSVLKFAEEACQEAAISKKTFVDASIIEKFEYKQNLE